MNMKEQIASLTQELATKLQTIVVTEVQKNLANAIAGIGGTKPQPAKPAAKAPQKAKPVQKAKAPQKAKAKVAAKPAQKGKAKKPAAVVKRDMTCRVADCQAPNRGPKYQFFCNEHYLSLSNEQKDDITKAYMAKKSGKANSAEPAAPAAAPATEPAPSVPPATPAA